MSIVFNFNIIKIFGKVCELDSPQVCLYWVTDVYWGLELSPAGVVVAAPMLGIVARVYIFHSLRTVAIIPGASPGQRKNEGHNSPADHYFLLIIKRLTVSRY